MDNFKTIYKVLRALEKSMDVDDPDWDCLSAEHLGISDRRWNTLMRELVESGYIAGVKVISTKIDTEVVFIDPRITLKGLEYLENNSMMQKAYRLAKGIKDITPGI